MSCLHRATDSTLTQYANDPIIRIAEKSQALKLIKLRAFNSRMEKHFSRFMIGQGHSLEETSVKIVENHANHPYRR